MNCKQYIEFGNSTGTNNSGKNSQEMSVLLDMNPEKICMVK